MIRRVWKPDNFDCLYTTVKWLWKQNVRNKLFVNVYCRHVGTFIRKTTNIRTDISYENFSELNKKNKISERRIIYIKQIKLKRNYEKKKYYFFLRRRQGRDTEIHFSHVYLCLVGTVEKKTCMRGREVGRSVRKNNCAATMCAASILGFIFYIICASRPRVPRQLPLIPRGTKKKKKTPRRTSLHTRSIRAAALSRAQVKWIIFSPLFLLLAFSLLFFSHAEDQKSDGWRVIISKG